MNADDQIDDPRPRSRDPFTPSEAWIDAFERQCTDAMLKTLRRYAAWLAGISGRQGQASYDDGEELLQNALVDITSGRLRWDPAAQALEPYLSDVLRLRARRERTADKQKDRPKHISIDDDTSSSVETEASLAVVSLELSASHAAAMTQRMQELRSLAADDEIATRFLDAFENDDADKSPAAIMYAAGLSSKQYYSARKRLARLYSQVEEGRAASSKVGRS